MGALVPSNKRTNQFTNIQPKLRVSVTYLAKRLLNPIIERLWDNVLVSWINIGFFGSRIGLLSVGEDSVTVENPFTGEVVPDSIEVVLSTLGCHDTRPPRGRINELRRQNSSLNGVPILDDISIALFKRSCGLYVWMASLKVENVSASCSSEVDKADECVEVVSSVLVKLMTDDGVGDGEREPGEDMFKELFFCEYIGLGVRQECGTRFEAEGHTRGEGERT